MVHLNDSNLIRMAIPKIDTLISSIKLQVVKRKIRDTMTTRHNAQQVRRPFWTLLAIRRPSLRTTKYNSNISVLRVLHSEKTHG